MTQEEKKVQELLRKRVIVENLWPGCQFEVGDILIEDGEYFWVIGDIGWYSKVHKSEIEPFPYLMRPLEWHEEREASEMPEYVKWVAQCHERGMIEPVIEWHKRAKHWAASVKSQVNSIRAEYFEPATPSDYHAYISSPELK